MLSERIFFATERVSDLLSLETEFKYVTKDEMGVLERELQRMHDYLRDVEAREDAQFVDRFCLEISSIVDKAEDILDALTSDKDPTDPIAGEIVVLLMRIEGFYKALSSEPIYNINTGNNVNLGGQQTTGSINVYIGTNSRPLTKRIIKGQSFRHVQTRDVVGFHWEIETLLHHLIQNDKTRVVGIVGMPGSGKTTLAEYLYDCAEVKKHFGHRVRVRISQSWNERDILYEILRQTEGATSGKDSIKNWSDTELVNNLYKFFDTQLYLVLLDDIWAVDAWNKISSAFPPNEGSKVLVTTRNEAVPKLLDPAFFVLQPNPLSFDESKELFRRRTLTDGNLPPACVKLGEEMVMKLKGLPLAITALAGALRVNKSLNHWMRISKTLTQSIMKLEDSSTHAVVKEVLAMSYHDLPYYLKPCFLYLGIFPEDYEIRTGMLMKIWIAERLITHDPLSEEETMLIAEEYLDDLTQRYIVQDVKRNYMGRVTTFQIHDLIREMCVEKAREKSFLKESHRVALSFSGTSFSQSQQQCRDSLKSILQAAKNSHLRSLIFIHRLYEECLEVNMLLACEKFKSLRVLILWGVGTCDYRLPEAVGNLIHLRYLGLRASDIEELPECIGNLQNLLTLDFRSFYADGGPPENLWKLKRLRHLYLPADYLEEEPDKWKALKLDKLENLQTLWYLRGGDWMLSEMAGLSPTLQKLCIVKIRNEEQLEAVFRCPSMMFGNLQTLKLDWSSHNAELQNMETFRHCEQLYKLVLRGKIRESKSISLVFPPNLMKLELQESELEVTDLLVILGNSLPYLKVLTLGRDAFNGTELTCNADSFPQLEQLKFEQLPNLKLWTVERGAMPYLKDLSFICCTNLYEFPEGRRFVSKLQQVTSWNMSGRFQASLQLWREQQADLPNLHPISPRTESSKTQEPCLNEKETTEVSCSNSKGSSGTEVGGPSSEKCEKRSEQGPGANKIITSGFQGFGRSVMLPVYMAGMLSVLAILVVLIGVWKAQAAVSPLS